MNFKRKIDYADITNFLPDNYLVGTTDFWRNKFNNKLPDRYYNILEVKSMVEFTKEEEEKEMEHLKELLKKDYDAMIKEFEERSIGFLEKTPYEKSYEENPQKEIHRPTLKRTETILSFDTKY